jgi:hypothetical protein
LGINRFTVAKDKGAKMGEAAGTIKHAYELFAAMQKTVGSIPSDYGDNYKKKMANALMMFEKS